MRFPALNALFAVALAGGTEERILFEDDFRNLENWRLEGTKKVSVEHGVMRILCDGSRQGGVGCMAFCRKDFPDGIAVEYDLLVHESNGLIITFVAMQGLNGEDAIADFPPRKGEFKDYTGDDCPLGSYHVSVSRYDDEGNHTGVSNWRRNPGLHLMAQGEDRCERIGRKYHIRIEKEGPCCALFVDGRPGGCFVDPQELPGAIPTEGKIGFRAIGSKVVAEVSRFRVLRLAPKS